MVNECSPSYRQSFLAWKYILFHEWNLLRAPLENHQFNFDNSLINCSIPFISILKLDFISWVGPQSGIVELVITRTYGLREYNFLNSVIQIRGFILSWSSNHRKVDWSSLTQALYSLFNDRNYRYSHYLIDYILTLLIQRLIMQYTEEKQAVTQKTYLDIYSCWKFGKFNTFYILLVFRKWIFF